MPHPRVWVRSVPAWDQQTDVQEDFLECRKNRLEFVGDER